MHPGMMAINVIKKNIALHLQQDNYTIKKLEISDGVLDLIADALKD